ncbi:MAG TPA: hypothetical protein VL092_02590 [Chitinophagaceae bacterium]|nr:hypothetical protein [Chitinophagaceae bacterium]
MTDIKLFGQFYNDALKLRAVVMTIPAIGPYLDLYFSDKGQKYAQERIDYLLDSLQTEMQEVQDHLLNKEMLDSEEGFDLMQKTFSATVRTRQKTKIAVFAKILKGAFTTKSETHDPELYLRIVEELSERELEIAFLLYSEKQKIKTDLSDLEKQESGNDAHWLSKKFPAYTKEEVEYCLPRIEKTRLFKEVVGSFIGYGGGNYNPTTLFSNFQNYIELNK